MHRYQGHYGIVLPASTTGLFWPLTYGSATKAKSDLSNPSVSDVIALLGTNNILFTGMWRTYKLASYWGHPIPSMIHPTTINLIHCLLVMSLSGNYQSTSSKVARLNLWLTVLGPCSGIVLILLLQVPGFPISRQSQWVVNEDSWLLCHLLHC